MGALANTAPAASAPPTMTAAPAYSSAPSMGMPAATVGDSKRNGQATAGLVLGIISLVMFWFWPICMPVGIVGIVMAALGMKSQKKGMAIGGLVTSIIGLFSMIVFIAIVGAALISTYGIGY